MQKNDDKLRVQNFLNKYILINLIVKKIKIYDIVESGVTWRDSIGEMVNNVR